MIRDPTPQDILPLVVQYLQTIGLKKSAKQIDSLFEHDQSPLQGISIERIIKYYCKNHNKLAAQFIHQEEEEVLEQQSEVLDEEVVLPQKNGKTHQPQLEEFPEEKPKKRFFQKCDDSLYANIPSPLRDNTHEAKRKFGAGDEYGEFGSQKLKHARGDSFKKEKGKLKNRQFQGMGSINTNACNGVKL